MCAIDTIPIAAETTGRSLPQRTIAESVDADESLARVAVVTSICMPADRRIVRVTQPTVADRRSATSPTRFPRDEVKERERRQTVSA
jgi:hypothetical protein